MIEGLLETLVEGLSAILKTLCFVKVALSISFARDQRKTKDR